MASALATEEIIITEFDPNFPISEKQAAKLFGTTEILFHGTISRNPCLQGELNLGRLAEYAVTSPSRGMGEKKRLRALRRMKIPTRRALHHAAEYLREKYGLDVTPGIKSKRVSKEKPTVKPEEITPETKDEFLGGELTIKEMHEELGMPKRQITNAFNQERLGKTGRAKTNRYLLTAWLAGRKRVPEEENLDKLNRIYETNFKTMEEMLYYLNTSFEEFNFEIEEGEPEKIEFKGIKPIEPVIKEEEQEPTTQEKVIPPEMYSREDLKLMFGGEWNTAALYFEENFPIGPIPGDEIAKYVIGSDDEVLTEKDRLDILLELGYEGGFYEIAEKLGIKPGTIRTQERNSSIQTTVMERKEDPWGKSPSAIVLFDVWLDDKFGEFGPKIKEELLKYCETYGKYNRGRPCMTFLELYLYFKENYPSLIEQLRDYLSP